MNEGKVHAALYARYRVVPPKGLVQRMVGYLEEKYKGPLNLAYDVGCGSGQSTKLLAPYFRRVVGTDISASQIEEAKKEGGTLKDRNIQYLVSPADKIPEEDGSVQMISVAQAAHWFDLPKFFEEGRRVLQENGAMCLYGYEFARFRWDKDPSKNNAINEAWCELYNGDLGPYWAAERILVDERYKAITIPYRDFTRDDSFAFENETSVTDIGNFCLTWSSYQAYAKKHGEEQGLRVLNRFMDRLMSILGVTTSPNETILTQRFSFFLIMARK